MGKTVKNPNAEFTAAQEGYFKKLQKKAGVAVTGFNAGTNRLQASILISDWVSQGKAKTAAKPKAPAPPKPVVPSQAWGSNRPTMPKECAPFAHLIPDEKDPDIANFVVRKPMFAQTVWAWDQRLPALYNGEAGTGKTTTPKAHAYMASLPYLCIGADSRLYSRELLGQINIKNGTSFFQEGLFLMLTQIPSRIHISEFNTQDTGAAMFWQSINNEKAVFVKEASNGKGKTFVLHKDCYISFDANPPNARHPGTQRYSVPQLDRLQVINFDPWSQDEIRAILDKQGLPQSGALAGFYVDSTKTIIDGGYRCMVSIRGIRRVALMLKAGFPAKEAFDMGILNQLELTAGPQAKEDISTLAKAAGFKL